MGTTTDCNASGVLPPDDNVPQPDTVAFTPTASMPAAENGDDTGLMAATVVPLSCSGSATSLPSLGSLTLQRVRQCRRCSRGSHCQ